MNTTTRQSDKAHAKLQMQRLAIAAGVTLRDGSAVKLGGPATPSTSRIIKAINFAAQRMTREQRSDAQDDYGFTGRHFAPAWDGSPEIDAIMHEWSGVTDVTGELSMVDLLLTYL